MLYLFIRVVTLLLSRADLPRALRCATDSFTMAAVFLVKVLSKLAEDGRIAIRHARTDARDKVKKLDVMTPEKKARVEAIAKAKAKPAPKKKAGKK
jgi:predicted RecB family endonuclease